jgi:hypothetical protein
MIMPRTNWTKVAEHLAASDPYAAVLLADGSIGTQRGEQLVARPQPAPTVDREARYEAWCRRGGRAVHPAVPAAA